MLLVNLKRGRARCLPRHFLFLLVFLLFAPEISAQGGVDYTGTGGRHTIQGRIFYPSGRRADMLNVRVVLETTNSGNLIVFADSNGSFVFRNLIGGNYTIVIDAGNAYEPVRESVYIDESASRNVRGGLPRTFNVPIYLTPKRSQSTETQTAVINAALAGVPAAARDAYERGLAAGQRNETSKAIAELKTAVELYPQFTLALNELGVQYLKTGNAAEAVLVLHQAVGLAPDDMPPRLNYAIALLNLKKFPEANSELRQVLKRNDEIPTAHLYLGIALIGERDLAGAEKELIRAASFGTEEVAQAHRYLGGIYWSRREYKRAADELEKYLKLSPKAADAQKIQDTIKELRSK